MPQREARAEAVRRGRHAIAALLGSEPEGLAGRCRRLGLPAPEAGGFRLPFFGREAHFDADRLELRRTDGSPTSDGDLILFLHYLAAPGALIPGGEFISFRDLPGGAFYWEPFRSRTSAPLLARYGSDPAGLRAALDRFAWSGLELGDLAARVHGFGNLYLSLVYNAAAEGFPAELNVLFDRAIKAVYCAEDAAAFASRICLGLL